MRRITLRAWKLRVPCYTSANYFLTSSNSACTYTTVATLECIRKEMSLIQEEAAITHLPNKGKASIEASRLMNLISIAGKTKDLGLISEVGSFIKSRPLGNHRPAYHELMSAYSSLNPQLTINLYNEMLAKGTKNLRPTPTTYSIVGGALARLDQPGQTLTILDSFVRRTAPVQVYNSVINAYCKSESFEDVKSILEQMLRKKVKPNACTYTPIVQAYLKAGNHQAAHFYLQEMQGRGIFVDSVAYSILINAHASANLIDLARDLFIKMQEHGLKPTRFDYTALMKAHIVHQQFDEALKVFDEMRTNCRGIDYVPYYLLISSYGKQKQPEQAIKYFDQMISDKMAPPGRVYLKLIHVLLPFTDHTGKIRELILEICDSPSKRVLGQIGDELVQLMANKAEWETCVKVWEAMKEVDVEGNETTKAFITQAYGTLGLVEGKQ